MSPHVPEHTVKEMHDSSSNQVNQPACLSTIQIVLVSPETKQDPRQNFSGLP